MILKGEKIPLKFVHLRSSGKKIFFWGIQKSVRKKPLFRTSYPTHKPILIVSPSSSIGSFPNGSAQLTIGHFKLLVILLLFTFPFVIFLSGIPFLSKKFSLRENFFDPWEILKYFFIPRGNRTNFDFWALSSLYLATGWGFTRPCLQSSRSLSSTVFKRSDPTNGVHMH